MTLALAFQLTVDLPNALDFLDPLRFLGIIPCLIINNDAVVMSLQHLNLFSW